MSLTINLAGVESASENTRKFVEPGIHTLTISKLEVVSANTGTSGIKITFDSEEAGASFTETFWTSPKALQRIQYLLKKFDGEEHNSNITLEALEAKLIGKTQVCIVDGREALSNPVTQEDGTVKVYTNVYPQLRFSGFVGENFTSSDVRIERLPVAQPSAPGLEGNSGAASGTEDGSGVPF